MNLQVVHLRNPLNVAEGRLDLLADDLDAGENNSHLRGVHDAHDRIERIITDVFALAKTGELDAGPEDVDLAPLARRVWADVEHGQAELIIEGDVAVSADPSLLERLLTNLLRNTIEYVGDTVHVRIGPVSDSDGFYVSDDGPGIPPAEQEQVFKWTYTTKEGGIGVGLRSVQRICNAHG